MSRENRLWDGKKAICSTGELNHITNSRKHVAQFVKKCLWNVTSHHIRDNELDLHSNFPDDRLRVLQVLGTRKRRGKVRESCQSHAWMSETIESGEFTVGT